MPKTAGKAAVRCNAIGMSELAAMEKHGKRLDKSSQRRKIRDDSPLVYGSLDLRPAYDKHMKGIRQNAAASKPVLHFIVRLPPELLDGPKIGRFDGSKEDRQKMMLAQAVRFINDTHGGSAVFAARVDRDEIGETIVDVFAVPRYEKRTKTTPADAPGVMWASATKFGKELAEKHSEEIRRRHSGAKAGALTGPRMVGIGLQSEFAAWFQRMNGVALSQKREKGDSMPDRLEKEQFDRIERRADIQRRWDARRSRRLDARADDLAGKEEWLRADRRVFDREVTEGRADLVQAAGDLAAERADLERREGAFARRVAQLTEAMGVLRRAVAVIGKKMGLPLPPGLSEALDQLDARAAELSAPEQSRDDARPGF